MKKKKITSVSSNKIVWANFIGCILIILLHSTKYKYFIVSQESRRIIDFFTLSLPEAGVPLFCTLSGFLVFKDIESDKLGEVVKSFKIKIHRRCKSLLIPYFIFNIFWMLFTIVVQSIPFISNQIESAIKFKWTFSDVFFGVFLFKFNGVAWYVLFLMIYVCFSPFIFWTIKDRKIGLLALCIYFIVSNIKFPNGWIVGYITQFNSLFFYCLGAYLAMHKFEIVNRDYSQKAKLVAVITIICSTIMISVMLREYKYILTILRMLNMYCIWILLDVAKKKKTVWFMNITFFVYMMHADIQKCINKLFSIILPNEGVIYAIINLVGGVIITYAIITILAKILIQYFPKIWFIVNGGRKQKRGE